MSGITHTRIKLFSVFPGLRTLIDQAPVHGAEGEEYDPHKREPQYAHAKSSALWELVRYFTWALICYPWRL